MERKRSFDERHVRPSTPKTPTDSVHGSEPVYVFPDLQRSRRTCRADSHRLASSSGVWKENSEQNKFEAKFKTKFLAVQENVDLKANDFFSKKKQES